MQALRERAKVNACVSEFPKHLFAVAAIGRHSVRDPAMIGEGVQRGVRQGVDRERGGKGFHIKRIRCRGILRSRTAPEEALRAGTGIGEPIKSLGREPLAIGPVSALRGRDT